MKTTELLTDQIRTLRTLKKISQQEMADLLGITQGAYNRIENGLTELRVKDLVLIAEKLQISRQLLFDGSTKMMPCNVRTADNNQNAQNSMTEMERQMFQKLIDNQTTRISFLENEMSRLLALVERVISNTN